MRTTGNTSTQLLIGVTVGVGAVVLTGAAFYCYKYCKRDLVPEKWRRIGVLAQLNFFPVKGCAPVKLEPQAKLQAELLGLQFLNYRDREFMLVDEEHKLVTARIYPRLVLIQPKIINETLLLFNAPGMETLELDFELLLQESPVNLVQTAVWGAELDVKLCSAMYGEWFSKFLTNGEKVLHLVHYLHAQPVRATVPSLRNERFLRPEDSGTFGDATSYNLINLASVEDLNTRLTRPVDALQFRGNFHLKMDSNVAFAEDHWKWLKIGDDAIFRNVAPCTRCIVPNVNVHTGERDPESEPLRTLKKFRQNPKYASPSMGIHLGMRQRGTVKLNDVIYVEDR